MKCGARRALYTKSFRATFVAVREEFDTLSQSVLDTLFATVESFY